MWRSIRAIVCQLRNGHFTATAVRLAAMLAAMLAARHRTDATPLNFPGFERIRECSRVFEIGRVREGSRHEREDSRTCEDSERLA